MAEEVAQNVDSESEEGATRIYEVGYHIVPTVKDEDVEKIVGEIRATIEKAGGSFIAEGAPSLIKLSYPISIKLGEKRTEHDRAHFGWIKFEAATQAAGALSQALEGNANIIRSIVFKTVREDTRAKMKAPSLREVKRTDTIKAAPRKAATETEKAPISEEELDKALETLTAE